MKQGASPVRRRSLAFGTGFAAALMSWVLTGTASATILYGPADVGLVAPDRFTSFEGSALAPGATITTEFAADGFTFTGSLRFAPCAGWPNTAGGWTPAGYGTSLGPACSTNLTDDTFSVLLASDASAASFTTHSDILSGGLIRIEVLKDGAVLESLDIVEANDTWCCAPQYVRIEGLTFDAIRFVDATPGTQSWIAVDNLAFNEAAAIPAPGALALFGLGLGGLGLARRHRAA